MSIRRFAESAGAVEAFARTAPIAAALFVAAPVAFVLTSFFAEADLTLHHVWATTGPQYVSGTLTLCGIVAVSASVIGVAAALLVSLTEFPGRRLLSFALVLPFAVPAYISAYAYADLFGPFGVWSRLFGDLVSPPAIRGMGGAALVLTLSVYPYVYLAIRASLDARSAALIEAGRTLGANPLKAALMLLLPAGRAAFAGGLALALMETAADFGVADYFGVPTLSVGIFRTWYGLGDLVAASQIAGALFLAALILSVLESQSRRGLGAEGARAGPARRRLRLSPTASLAAAMLCGIPVLLGFLAPVAVLTAKLVAAHGHAATLGLLGAVHNTGIVAGAGALSVIVLAAILAYVARGSRSPLQALAIRTATMGYAIPGAVIAIGILALASASERSLGISAAGIALLIYAYVARFITAGYNAVSAGIAQIHPLTDDAARVLGAGPSRIIASLHWPIARGAFTAGALIVFVDIAKELPATLLLRPFNFETLATRVYRLASDERLAEAAPAALLLIALSLVPVLCLDALGRRRDYAAASTARSTASQIKST